MIALLPNERDRIQELEKPIIKEDTSKLATRKIKHEIRKDTRN